MDFSFDAVLADARERLRGTPQDALGVLREGRRTFAIARAARIVPAGHAWHLGVLLLDAERIAAVGDVVRAREEGRRGFTAESQRRRAQLAAAAVRGGFAEGQTVHLGWRVLDLREADAASSPIAMSNGRPAVRWSPAGGLVPLDRYLDEQIDLLLHPPAGA